MCGIVGIFDLKKNKEELRGQALQLSKKQRHRGPDWSGIFTSDNAIMVHERLSIVDPTSGKQPLLSADGKLALADKDAQVIAKDGAGIRVFLSERPDERLPIGERLDPDALASPLDGAKLA